jgi:16S rRNA (cytidine1402-2'-O)-methyltransferase
MDRGIRGRMGTLYVVATPIGNLEDISPRALRILRDVTLIAAEDTRHTGKLLAHFGIETPTISYHAFNERARRQRLLDAVTAADIALVTDAGTPAISDPGVALVDAVLQAGYPVRTIPGPSSLTAAVSISGLLSGPFTFLGFLPRKAGERRELLARAAANGFGVVLYESPNRLQALLQEIRDVFEGRRFAVARELSKIHESLERRDFVDGDDFADFANIRGEIVVVIEPSIGDPDLSDPAETVRDLIAAGMRASEAARMAAQLTGRPRSELYKRAIMLEKQSREGQTAETHQPD